MPSDPSPIRLSVVMPVFNEAATIDLIAERVLRQAEVGELVIVDDGSTDGSWEKIGLWSQKERRVRAIRQDRNSGKGAALRKGFEVCRGTVLLIQDADLEYDPSEYGKLIAPIEANEADVVYGSRFAIGSESNSPRWHKAGNWILTRISNLATGLRLTDEATCYKVFRSCILRQMVLREDGFGFCPEFTAKIARLKLRVQEVPIRYSGRTHAQGKKIRFRDAIGALRCLIQYRFFD